MHGVNVKTDDGARLRPIPYIHRELPFVVWHHLASISRTTTIISLVSHVPRMKVSHLTARTAAIAMSLMGTQAYKIDIISCGNPGDSIAHLVLAPRSADKSQVITNSFQAVPSVLSEWQVSLSPNWARFLWTSLTRGYSRLV